VGAGEPVVNGVEVCRLETGVHTVAVLEEDLLLALDQGPEQRPDLDVGVGVVLDLQLFTDRSHPAGYRCSH
jgi:hypothetical protein